MFFSLKKELLWDRSLPKITKSFNKKSSSFFILYSISFFLLYFKKIIVSTIHTQHDVAWMSHGRTQYNKICIQHKQRQDYHYMLNVFKVERKNWKNTFLKIYFSRETFLVRIRRVTSCMRNKKNSFCVLLFF
jgi:hypothetical protein